MTVLQLIEKLQQLDTTQEIYIYNPETEAYHDIDYVEQWSDDPECSNHYTIHHTKDFVSG